MGVEASSRWSIDLGAEAYLERVRRGVETQRVGLRVRRNDHELGVETALMPHTSKGAETQVCRGWTTGCGGSLSWVWRHGACPLRFGVEAATV
jgi:hypothetical protein